MASLRKLATSILAVLLACVTAPIVQPASAQAMATPVVINELLASNGSTLADNTGEFSDWIELHNTSASATDLTGWAISDGSDTFVFPAGTAIAGGAYEVIFASGDVSRTIPGELHLPFKLSGAGESLTLTDNAGVLSQPAWSAPATYPAQTQDDSYGLGSGGNLQFFTTPTPGAANGAGSNGVVQPVEFSLDHGFYSSTQSLNLSTTTSGATIRYTTNGAVPTATSGTALVPGSAITITNTSTIRAVAYRDGWITSPVETRSYLFTADVLVQSAATPLGWPANDAVNGHDFDYEMDPDVVAGNEAAVTASLLSLPSISIVTDLDNLFDPATGIYVNPQNRGSDWERQASVELIDPTGADSGFDIEAGIRIRGGSSRSTDNPKHSLRMYFRNDYEGALDYPLFGNDGTDRFERLDLRTTQHESWTWRRDPAATFVEDVWSRDTQAAMGYPHTRSRQVHLYLNGQYWGLYMTQERVSDEYGESYFGGDEADYDVVKRNSPELTTEANDGDIAAWESLYPLVADGTVTAAEFEQLLTKVDLENLAAYYLLFFYSADFDGSPTWYAAFNGNNYAHSNNWYALRNRNGVGAAARWQFFDHDSEVILCQNLNLQPVPADQIDNTTPWPLREGIEYFTPAVLHQALISNESYRQVFANAVQQHMIDPGGALTVAGALATYDARVDEVDPAVLAESARWGDGRPNRTGPVFGRTEWLTALADERACIEDRWEVTRDQLTADNLWPVATEPTVVDLSRSEYDYDFGLTGSPVGVPGDVFWEPITPLTSGDISWSSPVTGRDRGAGIGADDINRDLVFAAGSRTLSHRIANGLWAITVNMGDTCCVHDDMSVTVEGAVLAGDVDAPTGTFTEVNGQVVVNDGSLDIEFDDLGGADPNWVVNRLSLQRLPDPDVGLILNEWNAVSSDQFIEQGDSFYGSVLGNGGDWFELVVVDDHLDVRGWQLELTDSDSGVSEVTDTLVFADDSALADLRAGTIITVSEDLADDVSFDPASDDWSINLQAESGDAGHYFTASSQSNFNTDNDDWQLRVLDESGLVRFGPVGEGIGGLSGVSSTEVGELEENPTAAINAGSLYDDGKDSTFGAPNGFDGGAQDFSLLRDWFVPPADSVAPVTTIETPTAGAVLTDETVVVSGSSVDDNSVVRVRVAIVDRVTGEFLQRNDTFGANRVFSDATLDSAGAASTAWSITTTLTDGTYRAIVKADDAAGNVETSVRQSFSVAVPVDDSTAPVTTVTSPAQDETITQADVTLTGTTVDSVDVDRVRVAVTDRDSGLFLQPDGTFDATRTFTDATLDSLGGATTGWSFPMTLVDGRYRAIVKANDSAGNIEAPVRREFNVSTSARDTVPPTSTITSPADVIAGAVTFEGDATDDVAVGDVRIIVRSRDNGLYVQADGSLASSWHAFTATLTTPDTPSTAWSLTTDLSISGRYRVISKATDTSANAQATSTATNIVVT